MQMLIWAVSHLMLLFLQVRFELTFYALNPELKVVAPWREWDITGREDAIEYAKKHNVPVPVSKKSIYSRDRNLWHLSHEVYITYCPVGSLIGFLELYIFFLFLRTCVLQHLYTMLSSKVSNQ
jgi:hypothetical protein